MNRGTIDTPIGTLVIRDVYEYYDGPRLFSCESLSGQFYLALWVESEQDADRWLFLPLSRTRLHNVKVGTIPLREALRHPEDGWLWEVRVPYGPEQASCRIVQGSLVPDDDLPDQDVTLSFPDQILPIPADDATTESLRSRREIFDIEIDTGLSPEVDADNLGSVLLRFQYLARALAHTGAHLGPLRRALIEQTTLSVIGFHAGSFGVRLASKGMANFFGETKLTSALDMATQLFEAGDDREQLGQLLPIIRGRAMAHYRGILKTLRQSGYGFKVSWASPGNRKRTASLPIEKIRGILSVLGESGEDQKETYQLNGTLVAINTRTNHFEIVSSEDQRYSGTIAEKLAGAVFEVPATVTATIEETFEINPTTGEEKVTYCLVGIEGLPIADLQLE